MITVMHKFACYVPAVVGVASAEVITPEASPSLSTIAVALAGLSATAVLVWRGRGEVDRINGALARIEKTLERLPCVVEHRTQTLVCPDREVTT